MRHSLKNLLNPSMAVALVALVLAVGGTSYAAVQVARDSVSAKAGPGPGQPVLGSGQVMKGYFAAAGADGEGGFIADAITFPAKLPGDFDNRHVQYILSEVKEMKRGPGTKDAVRLDFTQQCPALGEAKRGWMCFYEGQANDVELYGVWDQRYNEAVADFGVRLYWAVDGSESYADGQWVVRAP